MVLKYVKTLLLAGTLLPWMLFAAEPKKDERDFISKISHNDPAYLYTYHTGNGEDGLHFLYSLDGLYWRSLGNGKSFLDAQVGRTKRLRDASIARDAKGTYHLVWTCDTEGTSIGYASSKDLVHWSAQKELPVMASLPGAIDCKAPELIYQPKNRSFIIVWSSKTGEKGKSSWFYTSTSDFITFAPTKPYYNPGFEGSDVGLFYRKGLYQLFFGQRGTDAGTQALYVTETRKANALPTATPEILLEKAQVEAPAALRIGKMTYLYWTNAQNGQPQAMRTANRTQATSWENVSDRVRFPAFVHLGSLIQVGDSTLSRLQRLGN
jgi:beta-galactosidase